MRRPLDDAARRAAIHGSAEVSAAKHLARAYGVTMRRRRRVGAVVFDIGQRDAVRAHGTLSFTDDGALIGSDVYGKHMAQPSLMDLAQVFEFGTQEVDLAPEVIVATAPIGIIMEPEPSTPVSGPIAIITLNPPELLPVLDLAPVAADEAAMVALPPTTQSIPIIQTFVVPPARPTRAELLAQRRAAAVAELPEARRVWGQFFIGIALGLVALVVGGLALGAGPLLGSVLLTMSVVALIVSIGVTGSAVHSNDHRIETLTSLGLR